MGTGELLGKPNKLRSVTCDGLASHPRGVEILRTKPLHATETGISSGVDLGEGAGGVHLPPS